MYLLYIKSSKHGAHVINLIICIYNLSDKLDRASATHKHAQHVPLRPFMLREGKQPKVFYPLKNRMYDCKEEFVVSEEAVNRLTQNWYLSVRCWLPCWTNKVLIVTVNCLGLFFLFFFQTILQSHSSVLVQQLTDQTIRLEPCHELLKLSSILNFDRKVGSFSWLCDNRSFIFLLK